NALIRLDKTETKFLSLTESMIKISDSINSQKTLDINFMLEQVKILTIELQGMFVLRYLPLIPNYNNNNRN
ncbi:MAG: hypothetical protein O4749_10880, partial [Trichodesmium sp. St5_bin2_1]|nr:hypothetical protein [Trichodesmium sp. St5_bin2_1]